MRDYLEAQVAAALNPAAAPAVGARFTALIATVFPIAGVQDRSACMIDEFTECWAGAVVGLMNVARAGGVHLDAAEVTKALLANRGALGR